MATMGRGKKAVAHGWNAINKQRDEKSKKLREETEKKEKEISKEEHEKRLQRLKEIGLIK